MGIIEAIRSCPKHRIQVAQRWRKALLSEKVSLQQPGYLRLQLTSAYCNGFPAVHSVLPFSKLEVDSVIGDRHVISCRLDELCGCSGLHDTRSARTGRFQQKSSCRQDMAGTGARWKLQLSQDVQSFIQVADEKKFSRNRNSISVTASWHEFPVLQGEEGFLILYR